MFLLGLARSDGHLLLACIERRLMTKKNGDYLAIEKMQGIFTQKLLNNSGHQFRQKYARSNKISWLIKIRACFLPRLRPPPRDGGPSFPLPRQLQLLPSRESLVPRRQVLHPLGRRADRARRRRLRPKHPSANRSAHYLAPRFHGPLRHPGHQGHPLGTWLQLRLLGDGLPLDRGRRRGRQTADPGLNWNSSI